MAEYTYEDIIMDPEDPRLEGAIGKECFFSEYPKRLLNSARNNSPEYLDCLTDIRKEGACPFVDKKGYGRTLIIIKKEEPKPKPKYVPFKNITEFLDAYRSAPGCLNEEAYFLSNHGIWLKDKDRKGAYFMVTEIWNEGVVVSDIKMKTTKEGDDEYYTTNEETEWKELLRDFTFLDGSPCGKEVEEE